MSCAVSFNLIARDLRAHLDVLGLATALAYQSGRPAAAAQQAITAAGSTYGPGSARSDLIYLYSSADDGAHWPTRSAETPGGALS